MMEWDWVDLFPLVFFPFKIIVLGTGMDTFRQPVLKGEPLKEQLKTNDSLGG